MKHFLSLLMLLCSFSLCKAQATSLTIENQTPGWLSSKIGYGDQQTVQNLTVTGFLNSDDLNFIGTLIYNHSLNGVLDIEQCQIVDKNGTLSNTITKNVFSSGGTNNNTVLNKIVLPSKLVSYFRPFEKTILIDTLIIGGSDMPSIDGNSFSSYYEDFKNIIFREGIINIATGGNDSLLSIKLPESIKTIGERAFYLSYNLSTLNLPDNLETIGAEAFQNTSFMPDTLYLPKSLVQYNTTSFPIKDGQFVIIPKSVTTIKNTYSTYNNMTNIWTTHDYIEQYNTYKWIMCSPTPPNVEYYYNGFLNNSTVYIPKNSYSEYKQKPPFSKAKLVEIILIENISFPFADKNLHIGDIFSGNPVIKPSNAINKDLNWKSSIPDIATVDSSGKVVALKYGQTIITVSTTDNNLSASFKLNVFEHVTSVKLPESMALNISEKKTLIVQLSPEGKTDGNIEWKSSNNDIAIVDDNGIVKGLAKGNCTITATSVDGGHTAECAVTVVQPVESINVTPKTVSLKVSESSTLSATILPSNADDKSVSWRSTDVSVAKVDATGKITAISGGMARIYVTSNFDKTLEDFCDVTVIQPVTGILLNESNLEMTEDGSVRLIATVIPENATNKKVLWSSSDVSVAMVSGDGTVHGIKAGQATIMATTEDGGFSALCKVVVKKGFVPVSGITLDITNIEGKENETFQISAKVTPEDASNKVLLWQSSDEKVASVDNTGFIRMIKKGTSVISASATDGSNVKAECMVIVSELSGMETIITDKQTYMKIFNLSGNLVYEGVYGDLNLESGIYIILCDGKSAKIKIE